MTISEKQICDLAGEHKFNPVMLEKVLHLMHLMESLNSHPFLKGKWVLKGGTALNLFIFELPRLSVDIDLNYIGSLNREEMMIDRPKIEQACQAVFSREGFIIKRIPTDHAGGKWILSYTSYTGQPGNLEVDFNFMFRQTQIYHVANKVAHKVTGTEFHRIYVVFEFSLTRISVIVIA